MTGRNALAADAADPTHYVELTLELGELDAASVEAIYFEHGAVAVTLSNAAADQDTHAVLEPRPGEQPLWRSTRMQALLERVRVDDALIGALAARLGIDPERLSLRGVVDRVWEREWLRHFHAMRFGERLWICPQHELLAPPGAVVVQLDPGLAFGTGTHTSTALCLEWLDGAARGGSLQQRLLIDYGCGSGVLAVAALKLGARCAYAFDHDPQALCATRDNARRNGVSGQLRVCERGAEIVRGCDLLVANILAPVLIEHAAVFASLLRAGGQVLLSGILGVQEDEVAQGFAKWFDMSRYDARDGWVALEGSRY